MRNVSLPSLLFARLGKSCSMNDSVRWHCYWDLTVPPGPARHRLAPRVDYKYWHVSIVGMVAEIRSRTSGGAWPRSGPQHQRFFFGRAEIDAKTRAAGTDVAPRATSPLCASSSCSARDVARFSDVDSSVPVMMQRCVSAISVYQLEPSLEGVGLD